MKLKIPPVLQTLLFCLLMFGVNKWFSSGKINFTGQKIISIAFLTMALVLGVVALIAFRKVRTSVNPLDPSQASKLVITGIYKFSRNPQYVALLLGLIAIGIWMGNIYNLAVLIIFYWYITKFQILPEEEVLLEMFGDDYKDYCNNVRRWL